MNYKEYFNDHAKKTTIVAQDELREIQAGGAHPSLLSHVEVMAYEVATPLLQIAMLKTPDARTLIVTPFDKTLVKDVVHAIGKMTSGYSIAEQGDHIRVSVPSLNEEKRLAYVKLAKEVIEKAKISIRNIRHDVINKIKRDDDLSKDQKHDSEEDLQQEVKKVNLNLEELFLEKEKDLKKI